MSATGKSEKVFVSERHCDWLYTRGGQGNLSIKCTTPAGTFSVVASPRGLPVADRSSWEEHWELYPGLLEGDSGWEGDSLDEILREARSLVYLRFDARQLAKPSYSERDVPRLEGGGARIRTGLSALNNPDAFDDVTSHMRDLIPHFKRIRFRKVPIRRMEQEFIRVGDESIKRPTSRVYQGEAIVFDFENAENVSAHTVSEGTLMLLGPADGAARPEQPRHTTHGRHRTWVTPPCAEVPLGRTGEGNAEIPRPSNPRNCAFSLPPGPIAPEQIRLMTIGEDGYSVCGRLEDHPQFAKWKDEMAPGELWSLFGEKWLVEQGATK